MMHTDLQKARLLTFRDRFGIDTTPAQALSGDALEQWMNAAEEARGAVNNGEIEFNFDITPELIIACAEATERGGVL